MEPTIKKGDLILIKPVDNYTVGDVLTFCRNERCQKTTTHRIYDIYVNAGELTYVTQGDANDLPDTREVKENEVVGKTVLIVPWFGYLIAFIKQPIVFILLICLLLGLLVIFK